MNTTLLNLCINNVFYKTYRTIFNDYFIFERAFIRIDVTNASNEQIDKLIRNIEFFHIVINNQQINLSQNIFFNMKHDRHIEIIDLLDPTHNSTHNSTQNGYINDFVINQKYIFNNNNSKYVDVPISVFIGEFFIKTIDFNVIDHYNEYNFINNVEFLFERVIKCNTIITCNYYYQLNEYCFNIELSKPINENDIIFVVIKDHETIKKLIIDCEIISYEKYRQHYYCKIKILNTYNQISTNDLRADETVDLYIPNIF